MKELILIIAVIVGISTSIIMPIAYSSQMYYSIDKQTATNGILFHDTIVLDNYEQIGTATAFFCPNGADIFTRSIRHESFTVCR